MAKVVSRDQNNISRENEYLCKKGRGKRDEILKNNADFWVVGLWFFRLC